MAADNNRTRGSAVPIANNAPTMNEPCNQLLCSPSLLTSAQACTEACEGTGTPQFVDPGLFLPLSVEELRPQSPTDFVTRPSPVDACMTSRCPLVTPDACPLLRLEDERRVRFQDCDEEWLLTEETSVASASARCSEEASIPDPGCAKHEGVSPAAFAGAAHSLINDKRRQCWNRNSSGQETPRHTGVLHPPARSALPQDRTKALAAGCPMAALFQQKSPATPAGHRHLWLPGRENRSRPRPAQFSSAPVETGSELKHENRSRPRPTQFSSATVETVPESSAQRGRRHTAPGAFKTALIRSSDGNLQRRPLHSPPCLTTTHPQKPCVRLQPEGSLTGFILLDNHINAASGAPYIQRRESLPMSVLPPENQNYVVSSRRLQTIPGLRFSSLVGSLPFQRRARSCQSHVSQAAALVDIAALDID